MNITAILVLVAGLQVSAEVYSQKITLEAKDAPLEGVFKEIKQQTGYTFVYTETILRKAKPVTLEIHNAGIEETMAVCLRGQPFTYEIIDKTIVIKPAAKAEEASETMVIVPIDITGTVTGPDGKVISGVSVTVKGTKTGTQTDINGVFHIQVADESAVLVFSSVGYERQQVEVGKKTSFLITLQLSSSILGNVVVIGYGTQKRQDVNAAISSVTSKEIADIPQPSVDQLLQGKVAGVSITQNSGTPGSNVSVHIRGITTFGSAEPLYVIDGVAIQGDANNSSTTGKPAQLTRTGGGQEETAVSPLSLINPDDIESIDILKDASATAIYGNRGANGVVIITTKRGKAGNIRIAYDGYYGIQKQGKFLKMADLPAYAKLENAIADAFHVTRRAEFADPSLLGPGTDWQRSIFRNAPMQNHNISVSGGKNGIDYFISGGFLKQEGTILGSDFNRYSFRTNVNAQVTDWFKIGTSMAASRSNQDIGLADNTGIVYNALLTAPDIAIYNADGSFAGPSVGPGGVVQGTVNPVAQALSLSNTLNRNNVVGSIYSDLRFFRDLSLRSELNGNFNWNYAKTFTPTYQWGTFTNNTAVLDLYNTNDTYWAWKEYLNYTHTFNNVHNLTVLAGHEVWESTYAGLANNTKGFASGNQIQLLQFGSAPGALTQSQGSQAMESFMARVIYTYNNKYSLTATDRQDKSSQFAEGHKTGYFPSAAVSWRLSEEPFMAGTKNIINNLKIRLSYGTTGNANIPGYQYGSAISAVATGLGTGFITQNVANLDLRWETAIQKDAGIDFSLFNSRIEGSFDYFDKTSKNFLFQRPLPAFLLGATAEYSDVAIIQPPYVNAGEVENKGVEFSINSRNIEKKNFTWNTTVVFTHYNNKVVSLSGFPAFIGKVQTGYVDLNATKTVAGGPMGEFYGYKVKGLIKTTEQLKELAAHPQNVTGAAPTITNDPGVANNLWLGDIQYEDVSGPKGTPDGQVDANDQMPLGSPWPDFTYSITNNFTYKGFDLSIFLNGSHGGKILNVLDYQIAGNALLYQNQLASTLNYWTPDNPNSNIPAPKPGLGNNNLVMSDRFLESASFLRIQNVRIGYNIPTQWAKKIHLNRFNVYVSGQNLYVFTKYTGLDPEIGSLNQNPIFTNLDLGRYPIPRTITFGINAEF